MQLNRGSWPFRLYSRAYIEDRGWIDGWAKAWGEFPSIHDLPEYKALREIDRRQPKAWAEYQEWLDHRDPVAQSFNDASKMHVQALFAAKADAVRQRLENGRMSLCPFFWKTVMAVFLYLGVFCTLRWLARTFVVRPVVAIARFCGQKVRTIAHGLTLITIFAASIGVDYMVAVAPWNERDRLADEATKLAQAAVAQKRREVWEATERRWLEEERIAEAARVVARTKQEALWEKVRIEEERLRSQYELEKREAAEKWEREHPQEVRWERMLAAEGAVRYAIHERHEKEMRQSYEYREYLANVLWYLEFQCFVIWGFEILLVFIFIVGLLTSPVARFLGPAFRWLSQILGLVIDGLLIWLVVLPIIHVQESRPWCWLVRKWRAFRRLREETRQLIVEFIKAKKQRVCPFLTVVDDREVNDRI